MSVKEIGRRLIAGVWVTDVAEEGGGGSQAWRAANYSNAVSPDSAGASFSPLTWVNTGFGQVGADPLDLSTPTAPVAAATGLYVVSGTVYVNQGGSEHAGKYATATLSVGNGNGQNDTRELVGLFEINNNGIAVPVAASYYLTAGDAIAVYVSQDVGSNIPAYWTGSVVLQPG